MVINCLQLRNELAEEIKKEIFDLKSHGIIPSFAIIQIGNYPPSDTYVHVKMKKAVELGITTKLFNFQDSKIPILKIEELIQKLNHDKTVHGIIMQRPLPRELDENRLQSLIEPGKDIDGLSQNSPFTNPLIMAIKYILEQTANFNIYYKNDKTVEKTIPKSMVVIGKGRTAGKPIANYFKNDSRFDVKVVDSKTLHPEAFTKSADIIISCVGKANILRRDNIKKGAALISVGQHQNQTQNSKWSGDYDESKIADIASFYTSTPGGVGPLNVIFLLKNVIKAAKNTL